MSEDGQSPDIHIQGLKDQFATVTIQSQRDGVAPTIESITHDHGFTLDEKSNLKNTAPPISERNWLGKTDQLKDYKVSKNSDEIIAKAIEKISVHPDAKDYAKRFVEAGGKIIATDKPSEENLLGAFSKEDGVIFINTSRGEGIIAPTLAHELRHAVHQYMDLNITNTDLDNINDLDYLSVHSWLFSIEADAQTFDIDVAYEMALNGDTSGFTAVRDLQKKTNDDLLLELGEEEYKKLDNDIRLQYMYDMQQSYVIQRNITPDKPELARARAFETWFTSKDAPAIYAPQAIQLYANSLSKVGYNTDLKAHITDDNITHTLDTDEFDSSSLKKLGVINGQSYIKYSHINPARAETIRKFIPDFDPKHEEMANLAVQEYLDKNILPAVTLTSGQVKTYTQNDIAEYNQYQFKDDTTFLAYQSYKSSGNLETYNAYQQSPHKNDLSFSIYEDYVEADIIQHYSDFKQDILSHPNEQKIEALDLPSSVSFEDYAALRSQGLLETSPYNREHIPSEIKEVFERSEESSFLPYIYSAAQDKNDPELLKAIEKIIIQADQVMQDDDKAIEYNDKLLDMYETDVELEGKTLDVQYYVESDLDNTLRPFESYLVEGDSSALELYSTEYAQELENNALTIALTPQIQDLVKLVEGRETAEYEEASLSETFIQKASYSKPSTQNNTVFNIPKTTITQKQTFSR